MYKSNWEAFFSKSVGIHSYDEVVIQYVFVPEISLQKTTKEPFYITRSFDSAHSPGDIQSGKLLGAHETQINRVCLIIEFARTNSIRCNPVRRWHVSIRADRCRWTFASDVSRNRHENDASANGEEWKGNQIEKEGRREWTCRRRTLKIGGREDVQFLSHLPKCMIAYDQHSVETLMSSNCDTLNRVLTRAQHYRGWRLVEESPARLPVVSISTACYCAKWRKLPLSRCASWCTGCLQSPCATFRLS